MKKQSFVIGALILSISGVICKVLGAFYKIPLTNILGSSGIGIYYMVFPVFAFILSLTSTSMPASISRLISREIANGNTLGAKRIFRGSLLMLIILSGAFTIILMLLSGVLARLQGAPDMAAGYLVIAPAIFIVGILSAIRGWFQGHMNMVPTGVSQIIEQIFKLFLGLLLAIKLMPMGGVYGAVGALVGITLSEVFAVIYIIIHYIFTKKPIQKSSADKAYNKTSVSGAIREVFLASIPFVLGSSVFPLSLMLDSFLIVRLLESGGLSNSVSVSLLGINSGIISTMVSLPTIISLSLSLAIIPTLARGANQEETTKKISLASKLNLFLLVPCAVVYLFFAPEVLGLLFGAVEGLEVAAVLLQVSALSVIFLGFLQVATAILQGMGKPYLPVISMAVAIVVKVVLEVILLSISEVNILGAIISNVCCFFVGLLMNLIFLKRIIKFKIAGVVPLCLSLVGLVSACFLGLRLFEGLGGVGVVLAFMFGAVVFAGLVVLGGAFSRKELGFLVNKTIE